VSLADNKEIELDHARRLAREAGKKYRQAAAELENVAFEGFDLERTRKENELLESWIRRKKSSLLWKPFSAVANLEWDMRRHARALKLRWPQPGTAQAGAVPSELAD
jgi:hypothetical protein